MTLTKDEKRKLRLVKEKERANYRFEKWDKRFGDPLLRGLAEQDATSFRHYKDWVKHRRGQVVAVAIAGVDLILGIVGGILTFVANLPLSGLTEVLLGLGIFNLVEGEFYVVREELAFSNMHNALNHRQYDSVLQIVAEALEEHKAPKKTKTKTTKKEDK